MLSKKTNTVFGSFRLYVSLLALLLVCAGCQQQNNETTRVVVDHYVAPVLFNDRWEFFSSDTDLSWETINGDVDWKIVNLPHTPRIEPKIVNDQWQGFMWYRKKITASLAWESKLIYLDFDAAMNVAEVWLDDKKLTQHMGGFLPFSVELPALKTEQHYWITIKLDNRDNPITGPKPLAQLDFNTYGGLYRNVWLRLENAAHITDPVAAGKVASGGVFVTYPKVAEDESLIQIKTHLRHPANTQSLQLQHKLYLDEQLVATAQASIAPQANLETESIQTMTLVKPKLWSPATPTLYRLESELLEAQQLLDKEVTTIGIREFTLRDNHLYINGKKSFLRGVNRHQEYPYIGYALSDAAQIRDAEKIKAAGFDYVRLSHYPHSKAFMRAADELGLVLLDAILGWQYVSETPEFTAQVVQTCRDLIRRDRNHPSVLAWECSLNESWMQESLIDQFTQVISEEFPGENVYSAGWQEYGYDIYLQARQHRLEHYQKPQKPYVVSEYGDWEYYAMNAGLQQDTWQDLLQSERSSRQLLSDGETRLQQQARNIIEAHNDNYSTPAFADGYWVMFDYNRGYADDLEASGIMSIDRLPKFSYYFYQSQRDADDFAGPLAGGYMVHLATYWQQGSALTVPIYTNAERVELYLNGKRLGESVIESGLTNLPHPPHTFTVPAFVAGELKAVAFAQGKEVAEHRVITPGEVSQLELALDKSAVAPLAGYNDVVFVRAILLDAAGNNARVNGEPIQFSVTGDARLVSPAWVVTENGTASALLQLGADLSLIKVDAQYKNIHAEMRSLIE